MSNQLAIELQSTYAHKIGVAMRALEAANAVVLRKQAKLHEVLTEAAQVLDQMNGWDSAQQGPGPIANSGGTNKPEEQ